MCVSCIYDVVPCKSMSLYYVSFYVLLSCHLHTYIYTYGYASVHAYIYIVLPNIYIYINIISHDRRKFKSQTFDNMDRWKSRGGKSQRRERKKKDDQRKERVRRKKMQVRESQNNVFPMFCGSGGSKRKLVKVAGAKPSDVRTAFGS